MKKKKKKCLLLKNVFKVSDFKTQKKSFNERFEKYINFVKISFNLPLLYVILLLHTKRLHLFIGGNSYEKFNRYICKIV